MARTKKVTEEIPVTPEEREIPETAGESRAVKEAEESGEYNAMADPNAQKIDDGEEIELEEEIDFADGDDEAEQKVSDTGEGRVDRRGKTRHMLEGLSATDQRVIEAGKRKRKKLYNEGVIVTKNGPVPVTRANSPKHREYMTLVQSAENLTILQGKLLSERATDNGYVMAEVAYGEYFTVSIPVELLCDLSIQPSYVQEAIKNRDTVNVFKDIVHKRTGATIDFVVKQVNEAEGTAIGSHVEAMVINARRAYQRARINEYPQIMPRTIAEATVMQVNPIGIFVEVFGAETFIAQDELDWLRQRDVTEKYSVGDSVNVKVLSVQKGNIAAGTRTLNTVKISASVKQTRKNPNEEFFNKFNIGNCALSEVTQLTDRDVFVTYANRINVRCNLPKDMEIPPVGSEVMVKIVDKREDEFRFTGEIRYIIRKPEM